MSSAALDNAAAILAARGQEYSDKFANPYEAAKRGYIDAVILPQRTRFRICNALVMLEGKQDSNPRKKHGNIPL